MKRLNLHSNIKIETERLIMEPVHERFTDEIFQHFTSEVTRFMPHNPRGERADIVGFVAESKQSRHDNSELVMTVTDHDGNFIGCCGIHDISPLSAELGLWLKTTAHGQGFGTEIIAALINFLEKHSSLAYIVYPVSQENKQSIRIAEKLGFKPFRTYSKHKTDSIVLNMIEYRKTYPTAGE